MADQLVTVRVYVVPIFVRLVHNLVMALGPSSGSGGSLAGMDAPSGPTGPVDHADVERKVGVDTL